MFKQKEKSDPEQKTVFIFIILLAFSTIRQYIKESLAEKQLLPSGILTPTS
jgi:hypothetical protein